MAKEKEHDEVNGGGYSVTDFIKDMPCILDWDYPKFSHPLWVFWSRTQIPPSARITEKIKHALLRHSHAALGGDSNTLVQFWAPATISGRRVLKTSNQPFSINRIERGLCKYRKHCIGYEIDVESEEGGVIGRVFRREYPEINPDLDYYSITEYPQRDFALECGVRRCLALPVFEISGQGCLGVLEVVDTAIEPSFNGNLFGIACSILQVGNFKSFSRFDFQMGEDLTDTVVVINEILEELCKAHQLPLAQIWIPCNHSSGSLEKRCNGFDLTHSDIFSTTCSSHVVNHDMIFDFSRSCAYHPMRKGQGLVGKALLSHKACFCRDISQLPITEYPLAHYARKCGLTGCFAICLRDNYIENQDYVLEFFLPHCETSSGDPQNFLDSLLATMKKFFGGLKISSGEELGDELSVEVVKSSLNEELDSFKVCQSRSPLVPGASENEKEEMQLNVLDEQLSAKTATDTGRKVSSAEQNAVAVTCSETESGVETSELEHRTTEISLSRDDLKQHFGKKLEDAAKILGVSRSSLKRVCRECGIERWPFPKRKKVNPSSSRLKHVNEFVEGGKERIPKRGRKEPSCSKVPPKQAPAAVPCIDTDATPMQVVRTMTVKATYGDDIIKFHSPFSSTRADLVEKVTTRFPVKDTPLSIKYEDDDGDWVLIACDEDLQECMESSRLLGKTTIRMLIQPVTNQAPRT